MSDTGTLIVSMIWQGNKVAVRGNLITDRGTILISENTGSDGWKILADELKDISIVRPSKVVVFTNNEEVLKVFTPPIRLQPRTEKDMDKINPHHWTIIRCLCWVNRWKFVKMDAEKMKRTMELWQQM